MSATTTDRFEKTILLKAPRSRVWRANLDAEGVRRVVRREAGGHVRLRQWSKGSITYPGYEHLMMQMLVDRIEPEHLFSYRWHPYAVDAAVTTPPSRRRSWSSGSTRPKDGTRLTITESGFDKIPVAAAPRRSA